MDSYSIVYVGDSPRVPFYGGSLWFDQGVPQLVRGDLAAQLLGTVTISGRRQFQVETLDVFNAMQAAGFIGAGLLPDGWVFAMQQPQGLVAGDAGESTDGAPGGDISGDESSDDAGDTSGDESGEGDTPGDDGKPPAGDVPSAQPRRSGRRNTGAQA